jgi:phage baseplate assembly protein V
MISMAVINRVNEALAVQRLQVTLVADEVVDDVDHVQPYGTSFNPPSGSEAIVLNVGGMASYPVAILSHKPGSRPTDADPGCGGLYVEAGWKLYIDSDGKLNLGAKAGASAVARADKVDAEVSALKSDIDNIKTALASIAGTAPTGGGPVVFTAWTASLPTAHTPHTTASDTVMCDPE